MLVAWTRENNVDGQIWDVLEVELEGGAVRLVVRVEEEKENLGDPRVWLDQLGDCWCHLLKWERQVGKWILLREGIMGFWSRSLI